MLNSPILYIEYDTRMNDEIKVVCLSGLVREKI
mgnify:FL=1